MTVTTYIQHRKPSVSDEVKAHTLAVTVKKRVAEKTEVLLEVSLTFVFLNCLKWNLFIFLLNYNDIFKTPAF